MALPQRGHVRRNCVQGTLQSRTTTVLFSLLWTREAVRVSGWDCQATDQKLAADRLVPHCLASQSCSGGLGRIAHTVSSCLCMPPRPRVAKVATGRTRSLLSYEPIDLGFLPP